MLGPAELLVPLNGSDRIAPAIEGFYFWASGRSVTLPASRYNYISDWTPLLVRLSLTTTSAHVGEADQNLSGINEFSEFISL
jgi:hypothetical protein